MNTDPLNKRIILALDVNTVDEAKKIVNLLKDKIKFYKVGLQLFLVDGIDFLKWLKDQDVDIMLDLKFFDIPRTIDAAVSQVQEYARFLTVHSQCNILSKVSEEYRKKILGVTVLTCFENSDIQDDCGIEDDYYPNIISVEDLVRRRVVQTYRSGCAGSVLSGSELKIIRSTLKTLKYQNKIWDIRNDNFVLIVPGIQLEQKRQDDQKRVTTIEDAFENGADYVVIGRPILQSINMIKTVELAQKEISEFFQTSEEYGIRFGIATGLPYVIYKYPEGE